VARETGGDAWLAIPSIVEEREFSLVDLAQQVEGFNVFLQAQIRNVTQSLASAGVTFARKKLRNSVTDWGESRMAGNHYGVSFRPYGRSSGREETGFMYDSLSGTVDLAKSGKTMWKATVGWDDAAISKAPYIGYQETGFFSTGAFDPVRTKASGIAKFKTGPQKYIEGAGSTRYALEQVQKLAPSAYSAALNEAIKVFNASGFKGDPKKYADLNIPPKGVLQQLPGKPYRIKRLPNRFSKGLNFRGF
jgi:hypothetical protein